MPQLRKPAKTKQATKVAKAKAEAESAAKNVGEFTAQYDPLFLRCLIKSPFRYPSI